MCILTNSAIRVIGASFFLLVLLSGIPARAQVNCPSAGTQGGVGFSNDAFDQRYSTCAQVTVPKGRQFIILQVNEFTMRWQGTNGCSGDWAIQQYGSCTPPMTMQVSVTGMGLNYTSDQITAPFSSPPSDFGWSSTTLEKQCVTVACIVECEAIPAECDVIIAATGDSQTIYSRWYYKVLALPGGTTQTDDGTVMVQLNLSASLNNYGTMLATVYGDTQFTMTQTSSTFRPFDARDPVVDCPQTPSPPLGDNCHQIYQVQLTLPGRPGVVLSSQARRAGPGLPTASTEPKDLTMTGDFTTLFQFGLAPPTRLVNGSPAPGAWLPGTSTNYTPPNTDLGAPDPDYVMESRLNPSLTIDPSGVKASIQVGGIGSGPPSTTVIVTSNDFGGSAEFSGTALIQGMTFNINVVDTNGNQVQPPSDGPMMLCGTDFAKQPFASLPVDQDCNGIADSWEAQYTNPPGGHLDPTADNEPGYDGTTVGDGYSVHDEYRGFHYIQDAVNVNDQSNPNGVVRWTSTDPVNIQDVFFWDSVIPAPGAADPCRFPTDTTGSTTAGSTLQPNCVTTAIRSLLEPQMVTSNSLSFGGQPFMKFWRVNAVQASARSGSDPTLGVKIFNKNSITQPSVSVFSQLYLGGYAVVYGNVPNDKLIPGLSECGPTNANYLGFYANANGFANNGLSLIDIAMQQIVACASNASQSPGDGGYPQATLLAMVVAHETGHRFGLFHTYRPVVYAGQLPLPTVADSFFPLSMDNYMDQTDAPATIYLRYAITQVSNAVNPSYQPLDRLADLSDLTPPYLGCPDGSQDPLQPIVSGGVWLLRNCNFQEIPRKVGPIPPGQCLARYATLTAPTWSSAVLAQPFLTVETSGRVSEPERGQVVGNGLDLMGIAPVFNRAQFGTTYSLDPLCELPYLNPTPAPQRAN